MKIRFMRSLLFDVISAVPLNNHSFHRRRVQFTSYLMTYNTQGDRVERGFCVHFQTRLSPRA